MIQTTKTDHISPYKNIEHGIMELCNMETGVFQISYDCPILKIPIAFYLQVSKYFVTSNIS